MQDIKVFPYFPQVPTFGNWGYPTLKKWQEPEQWLNSAEDVKSYAAHNPNMTGTSLITGKPSGLMVIDLDVGHSNSKENGIKNFKAVYPEKINTLTGSTPSGGIHYFFKNDPDFKTTQSIIPAVDLLADKANVINPYSRKKLTKIDTNGKKVQYGDSIEYTITNNVEPIEMPPKLKKILLERQASKKSKKTTKKREPANSLSSEPIEAGQRNDTLFKVGISIFKNYSYALDFSIVNVFLQVLNKSKCKPPLEASEVQIIAHSIHDHLTDPERLSYYDEKDGVIIPKLCEFFKKNSPTITQGHELYVYNQNKGVYDKTDSNYFYNYYIDQCKKESDKNTRKSEEFLNYLKITAGTAEKKQNEKNFIAVKNGVIDLNAMQLLPHGPQYKLIQLIQAEYKPESYEYSTSHFKSFIDDICPNTDTQKVLQEMAGLVLSPHAKEVAKGFVLLGEGSNGKSAFLEVILALIGGVDYISSVGLGDFDKDFSLSACEGKQNNIVMDDDLTGARVGKAFKSIIMGESVTVNKKYLTPQSMRFNMTHIFCLNRMPAAKDKSKGFYRRLCIIPFNTTFGPAEEVEAGMANKLIDPCITSDIIKNELNTVLIWALEGLQRLKNNNYVLSKSKEMVAAIEEYKEDSDTSRDFFHNYTNPKPGINTPIKDLYKAYRGFCDDNYYTPLAKNTFGKQLKSFGVQQKIIKNERTYLNIALKDCY